MRTIALRLTGTKSAKEELEELGEDTDAMLTTQSKLRETIMEATSVASNNWKGFDILDENGNYKSTYEIMLGIAEIYDEIAQTDKELGRNNLNLLLETVAGKVRANIAASIFQSPDVLKAAYKSSQEADNSAMRENEKYMASISGHLAQLKNAWQEMWANAANRDVLNFFIDLGKAVIKLVDSIGVLPSSIALFATYGKVLQTGAGKGKTSLLGSILEYFNGVHEAKGAVESTEEAAEALSEVASSAEEVAEATSEAAKGVAGSTKAFAGLSKKADVLVGALKGIIDTIGLLPFGVAVGAIVGLGIAKGIKDYKDKIRQEAIDAASAATDNIKSQQENLAEQISSYSELKDKLRSGNLSEEETLQTKQDILEIQKAIVAQYGNQANNLDLINGDLQEQLNLIKQISNEEAHRSYNLNAAGFDASLEEYQKSNRQFYFDVSDNNKTSESDRAKIEKVLKDAGLQSKIESYGTDNFVYKIGVETDATSAVQDFETALEALDELQKEYEEDQDFSALIKEYRKGLEKQLSDAYKIVQEHESTALTGLMLRLQANKPEGYDAYQQYVESISNLESAYLSGSKEDIEEAKTLYEEATQAKEDFLNAGRGVNSDYALLFNNVDTSFVDKRIRTSNAVSLLKQASTYDEEVGIDTETDAMSRKQKKAYLKLDKAARKYGKSVKDVYNATSAVQKLKLDKTDAEAVFLNSGYAAGDYTDALYNLMNILGYTKDESGEFIDILVDSGIVQGDISDATKNATMSYNEFSIAIAKALENLNSLKSVMSESVSGEGISTQNIDAFRDIFGADAEKAIERTTNGLHINSQAVRELQQQQSSLLRMDYSSALNEQYNALQKLYDAYATNVAELKDVSGYKQQIFAVQENINKIQDLINQYDGANSAYQRWLTAQSGNGNRNMYDSIEGGYETVKDLLNRGWADDAVRSYLDLLLNDEAEDNFNVWTASASELRDRFNEIDDVIEGTGGKSIADFFTVDKNGKTTSAGVWNFFEAIEKKQKEVGEEFVNLEEGWFDFTENGDYKVADLLGIDVEAVQAILRAAEDAGFEVNLDQPIHSIERLRNEAEKANDSLKETTNLNFNLDADKVSTIDTELEKLVEYKEIVSQDTSIPLNIKTEKLENLQAIMDYLIGRKRELIEDTQWNVAIDDQAIANSTAKIKDNFEKLKQYVNQNEIQLSPEIKELDVDSLNTIEEVRRAIQLVDKEQASANVDISEYELLQDLMDSLLEKRGLLSQELPIDMTPQGYIEAEKQLDYVTQQLEYAEILASKGIPVHLNQDAQFTEALNQIANMPDQWKIAYHIDPDATTEDWMALFEEGEFDITAIVSVDTSQAEQQMQGLGASANTTTTTTTSESLNLVKNETENHTSITVDDQGTPVLEKFLSLGEQVNNTQINPSLVLDTSVFDKNSSEVDKKMSDLDKTEATPSVTLLGLGQVASASSAMQSAINGVSGKTVDINAHVDFSEVDSLINRLNTVINKKNSANSITVAANGTAHVGGTAFARGNAYRSGDWGIPKDETALVGELGTEIAVTPDGKWQTIGENGAEFARLKKGTIIFNHKQSEELLKNGYVTSNNGRGHLIGFANGSAYSYGTGSGAIKPTVSSKNMAGKNTGGGSNNKSSGSGNSNRGNNKSSSNKDAEKTKNTLDEVEILISRIERLISRLDNTISNTYIKWSERNKAITRDLEKVSQEIKDQQKAYTTYMKKANSLGLSAEWVDKIQKGKFAIEDVKDSDLWQKIQDYKTWYEKALAAQDKIQELEQKQGELYKQRFDNEQTYYQEVIDNLQHTIDIMEAYNDQLEEGGKLTSRNLIIKQISVEQAKLKELESEYEILTKRRDEAVNSGKIKKYSEAWYEMQQAIDEVSEAIVEANTNLITFANNFREVNWNRWDKIHDAISGVTNELEFLYDLINEDEMFDDTGTITNYGITAFGILAQEYDTYAREIERYQKEINTTQKELEKDPYNQDLVDKLKEQKEAQQDAASNLKGMKDAMIDVAENGVKKQIDYIKKLIEEYNDLLDTQKDQIEYAKKVSDQQKEINKLEKQYRAIQNDTSEEGATKRQKLKEQIEEKKQALQETQEDRRISETKDMLDKFEESFEDFLENKLKDIEGIIREGIDGVNNNTQVVADTIESLAQSYGYTISDTLQSTLTNLSNNLVTYFDGAFDNENVRSIAHGVDTIVNYYTKAQKESDRIAMADKVKETGTHIQAYVDEKGETQVGYFTSDGTQLTDYTGQAKSGNKIYRFENGKKVTTGNRWLTENGSKYYLNNDGTYATGFKTIDGKNYYFDSNGKSQIGWKTINGKKYHFNREGVMHTGLVTIANRKFYFDANGVLQTGKWQTINGKKYYLSSTDGHILTGKQTINGEKYTFYNNGVLKKKGWKKGTASVPSTDYAWTNEGGKAEAIIRKSDGAILTPLTKGDSVIPSNAMKNMYKALTDPEKYLKQYTTPDIKIVQATNKNSQSSPTFNMQFIANGVQDASQFANELMNNKKIEKWIQEITLGQANGNNTFRKYSYAIR